VVSLFRRKSPASDVDLVEDAVDDVEADASRPRGYTPSKRELGVQTPKRPSAGRRPGGAAAGPPLTKEEARARRRELRQEAAAEFRREGGPRDKGPERALVRDIVDSRRTVGTFFFGGALLVLLGSNGAMPPIVQYVSNLLWVALALGVVIDGILISRKVKRLVRERFPDTTQRMGSLYLYAIMRSLTFRRMRVPNPRVKIGEKI
jgi:hypothetical protein